MTYKVEFRPSGGGGALINPDLALLIIHCFTKGQLWKQINSTTPHLSSKDREHSLKRIAIFHRIQEC